MDRCSGGGKLNTLVSLWNSSGEYKNEGENENAGEKEHIEAGDDDVEDVGEDENVEDGLKGLNGWAWPRKD